MAKKLVLVGLVEPETEDHVAADVCGARLAERVAHIRLHVFTLV